MRRTYLPRRRGFTLVELLVVIAIIGVLVAMIFPAINAAKESANRNGCMNNMKGIHAAASQYEEAFGCLPPGLPNCVDPLNFGKQGGVSQGAWCQGPVWTVALMNYMDEGLYYEQIKTKMETSANTCEQTTGMKPPPQFICPSAPKIEDTQTLTALGVTNILKGNYAGNMGSGNYFGYKSPMTSGVFDIVDVRSNKGSPIKQVQGDLSMNGGWKTGSKQGIKFAQIQDGPSKTILAAEVKSFGSASDVRGAWTYGGMGGPFFTGKELPNAVVSDILPSCEASPPMSEKPYMFNCTLDTTPDMGTSVASARSVHNGGVVAVTVGGSVTFITDDIEPMVWQRLCTRSERIPVELP